MPGYPEETDLSFAGKMENKTFRSLQSKGVVDACFFIFSDFRWSSEVVKLMCDKISASEDTDIHKLQKILSIAMASKSGLVAFGD